MTEQAFHKDYLPLAETLYRVAFYMLESEAEAEDAVQEVFLKLWDARAQLDAVQSPKAYSIRLLKNLCLNRIRKAGGRIVCVGTTSVRTLETMAGEDGVIVPGARDTSIFIYPGVKIKAVDALITNFHLPQSTLLMLVSALTGREEALRVYREAVRERYRFFSFGDAMLIE